MPDGPEGICRRARGMRIPRGPCPKAFPLPCIESADRDVSRLKAMPTPSDLSLLLAQTGWTKALARRLAADVDLADDLVQDAWVTALVFEVQQLVEVRW